MNRSGAPSRAGWPLLLVVAIVGLNLRPFITAAGPIADDVQAATGLGLQGLSLLTLVPMLLMGLLAFAGPSVRNAIGARRALLAALAVLAAGSALRMVTTTGWALVGTAAIAGLGVAIIQAIFPGVIKRIFPHHTARVMGLYSSMLMAGGALGAKAAPVVAGWTGSWQAGLAWLALPALAALLLAARLLPADAAAASGDHVTMRLLGRPRTWLLMLWFGIANGGYSSVIAWLPSSYQTLGWSAGASASLLAVMAACQATAALVLPALIGRGGDRRPWLLLTLVLQATGFVGLGLWPQAAPFLWAGLVGAGLGGCFSLSMVVVLEHLDDAAHAGALSALMQGGGFLIAAIPPWIIALLHGHTGGFAAGWLMHLGCVAVVIALTLRLAPRSYALAMPALRGR